MVRNSRLTRQVLPAVSTQHSHSGRLKGVKIPVFGESLDKWPYFMGIFSLSDAIKLAHLNHLTIK